MSNQGFNNQNIIIAGGFRGMGFELSKLLLDEGAKIVLIGRDSNNGKKAGRLLNKSNHKGKLKIINGDLSEASTLDVIQGQIDLWFAGKVHHLAIFLGSGKTEFGHDFPLDHWRKQFDINVFSPIGVVQTFYRMMLHKEGNPSITLTAAISGIERVRAPMTYSIAKSAIISYGNHLAEALVEKGIRVNTISPGNVFYKGGRWEELLAERGDEIDSFLKKSVGMQRLGTAKELAWVYFATMSPNNAFMTGQNIVADGLQVKRIL
jgi:3-oxoacyl-[acyl-carrier protein] reductase